MQYNVDDKNVIFSFSSKNAPVIRVRSGDEVVFQTQDCFSNQINSAQDKFEKLDWNRMNPATGPVFVNGAERGDMLGVTVKGIEPADTAVVATGKGMGLWGNSLTRTYIRKFDIADGKLCFSDSVFLPQKPMIGVIGVAPESGEAVNCGVPGHHGGNMDNTMIGEGATVYFPVFQNGACLALGDVHAVMGDGEVCVCGAEVRAKVTVVIDLIKNRSIKSPAVETKDAFATIASACTLDEAVETSAFYMAGLIKETTELEDDEIAMLLSLSGSAEICQVVDPRKTARFVMPKRILNSVGFRF
jgi:amidase